jgi:hypothetical protein
MSSSEMIAFRASDTQLHIMEFVTAILEQIAGSLEPGTSKADANSIESRPHGL